MSKLFEVLPDLKAKLGLDESTANALNEFLQSDETELPEVLQGLKEKVSGLNSETFYLNHPEFREKVKNERLSETLGGIEKALHQSWVEDFSDLGISIEEISKAIEGKTKLSEKERAIRSLVKTRYAKTLQSKDDKIASMADPEKANETIEFQANEIRSLKEQIAKVQNESLSKVAEVRREYELGEINRFVSDYMAGLATEGKLINKTNQFVSAMTQLVKNQINSQYHLKRNEGKIEVFRKDDPTLKAVDSKTSMEVNFQELLHSTVLGMDILSRNNSGKEGNTNPVRFGQNKKGATELPSHINPNSELGKRMLASQTKN